MHHGKFCRCRIWLRRTDTKVWFTISYLFMVLRARCRCMKHCKHIYHSVYNARFIFSNICSKYFALPIEYFIIARSLKFQRNSDGKEFRPNTKAQDHNLFDSASANSVTWYELLWIETVWRWNRLIYFFYWYFIKNSSFLSMNKNNLAQSI